MAFGALRRSNASCEGACRVVSNVDGTNWRRGDSATSNQPKCWGSSLVKTFTTIESMPKTPQRWPEMVIARHGHGNEPMIAKHFVAVSTNAEEVSRLRDRHREHVRLLGVGRGPLSIDSAIGLSTMLAIGPGREFQQLLAGFHAVDEHFREAPLERSLPSWGPARGRVRGILRCPDGRRLSLSNQYLHRFPAYLQQLTMESNGKHVTLEGTLC